MPIGALHLEHLGIVVRDLESATEFFTALGLEVQGTGAVEGEFVDGVIGLEGAVSDLVMLETADGRPCIELARFRSPSYDGPDQTLPSNAPGLRHVLFAVDDLEGLVAKVRALGYDLVGKVENYQDTYLLCYVRGPEGMIVELAERISAEFT